MPVDLETLSRYLDAMGLHHAVGRAGRMIVTPFGPIDVRVFVCERGEGVVLQVPNVLNLSDCADLEACLVWMAAHTYRHKIGHFGYDPRDGEVDVSFFFPVQDGSMTLQQFRRLLLVCRDVALNDVAELRRIAHGGAPDEPADGWSSPKDSHEEERFADLVSDLFREEPRPTNEAPRYGAPRERWSGPEDLNAVPEADWLAVARQALASGQSELPEHERLRLIRDEVWPKLLELREASISLGHPYACAKLATEVGLSSHEELAVCYLAVNASEGGEGVDGETLTTLCCPDAEPEEAAAVLCRLAMLGVIRSVSGRFQPPYRVGPVGATAYSAAAPPEDGSQADEGAAAAE